MYQVQIFLSEVGEWYAWSGCDLQPTKQAAEKQAKVAKRFCWRTRVVKVR